MAAEELYAFWRDEHKEFVPWWLVRLDDAARRTIVSTVVPDLPESPPMVGDSLKPSDVRVPGVARVSPRG